MTKVEKIKNQIKNGKTCLGIELGSTRIKAILIDEEMHPIASGSYNWENRLEKGVWTYSLEDVWKGLSSCYASIKEDIKKNYSIIPKSYRAIGISGMMHGYMAFDKNQKLLVPFRTWRNTMTKEASEKLTNLFSFPVAQRWSIAHLYQAMLNKEPHVKDICYLNTLAGYVHWKLTDDFVLGIGDASGMFPIDSQERMYNRNYIEKFDLLSREYKWKIENLLPRPLKAGELAGRLTFEGARLIDREGDLEAGISLCPAEGDAGTGMVATNSVKPKSGNVSAGTSVFAMIILENKLKKLYSKLDMVTTPEGWPVAMAHANNCTGEYDQWMSLFREVIEVTGGSISNEKLYDCLLETALKGDNDCGGLLNYPYLSGEHLTNFTEGRPLLVRKANSNLNLANFMQAQLFSSLCALRVGLDILFNEEGVKLDFLTGQGGFFKTKEVGLKMMASATHTPCRILSSAGEGGAWGIAILASFLNQNTDLGTYLDTKVFKASKSSLIEASSENIKGFEKFYTRYKEGLPIEKAAIENL